MCRKLGKEQTEREATESKLAKNEEDTKQLLEQLELYKQMNNAAKKEYDDAERSKKNEIGQFEKKAHQNWVSEVYVFSIQ